MNTIIKITGGTLAFAAGIVAFNPARSAAVLAFAASTFIFASIVLDRKRVRK